jgi:transcription elongation factor Elf1
MFERPPFKDCPSCGREQAFGILSVSSESYERRCKFCGAKATWLLPEVDKKVLYLDQFAISEIYKVKKGKRRVDAPHAEFWAETNYLLDRAIIRQQIICPASNIHRDETIVYREGNALGLTHEMMGGDTSFEDATTIEHGQIYSHLEAYLKGEDPPSSDFDVDEVLNGQRNAWLPDLHVTAEIDWSDFVENTRLSRDKAEEDFAPLYDRWAREKPSFEEVLKNELGEFARAYVDAYFHFGAMAQAGAACGDVQKYINGVCSPIVTLINEINREFVERGTPPERALQETVKFLNWPRNRSLPYNWISAHLFAVIASRLARGQRRRPSRGMMNDIKAISLYGPYVDAMFLDNECASILEEKDFVRGVKLKARIFCLRRSVDFLAYLRELIDSAPQEVIDAAQDVYGES